jgi:hypothetical protein
MTKHRGVWSALLGLFALSAGCGKGEPPRELRLDVPDVISSKEPVLVHARAVQHDGTQLAPRGDLDFKVTPPDLATVDKRGRLTCARTGDGSVTVQLMGVSARAAFSCKLAARLEAPPKLSIDAAQGEADVRVAVLDSAGMPLDLPVSISSDRGGVVSARGGKLVPGSVGTAKLTARAGALSRQIEVEVVRTIKPEALPIDQNRRISYSLDAGKYRLSIALPSPHAVKVDWLGAPYCAYRGTSASHQVDCTLHGKGSVSFDNPAFLLRGDTTPSTEGVTLREVP